MWPRFLPIGNPPQANFHINWSSWCFIPVAHFCGCFKGLPVIWYFLAVNLLFSETSVSDVWNRKYCCTMWGHVFLFCFCQEDFDAYITCNFLMVLALNLFLCINYQRVYMHFFDTKLLCLCQSPKTCLKSKIFLTTEKNYSVTFKKE